MVRLTAQAVLNHLRRSLLLVSNEIPYILSINKAAICFCTAFRSINLCACSLLACVAFTACVHSIVMVDSEQLVLHSLSDVIDFLATDWITDFVEQEVLVWSELHQNKPVPEL